MSAAEPAALPILNRMSLTRTPRIVCRRPASKSCFLNVDSMCSQGGESTSTYRTQLLKPTTRLCRQTSAPATSGQQLYISGLRSFSFSPEVRM